MNITYPKKGEATEIPKGKFSIKTGTQGADGNCSTEAAPAQVTGAKAKITDPTDTKGPTLTFTDITNATDLADTSGTPECTVSEDAEKGTLTIKYTQGPEKKCIEIKITGTDTKKKLVLVPLKLLLMATYLLKVLIPFYLIDKIEMVLLIATFFPPVIVALLNRGVFGDSAKARSPKTCPEDPGNVGMGGWRTYTPKFCGEGADGTTVDNSFWHSFDIFLVIKICLASAVLWTKAYYKGKAAMDSWAAPEPNQRACQKLKVEAIPADSPANELTYSIGPNFDVSHATADGKCNYKGTYYYLYLVPPSLMVLVGIGIPLKNLAVVATVSRFVYVMELIGIVPDFFKSNIAGETITTSSEVESKSSACF